MNKSHASTGKFLIPSGIVLLVLLILAVVYILISPHIFDKNREPYRNVILIYLDTLRADHMGIYGYDRETSPAVDEIASESIVFERAYSQSPNTLISHATMLTSLQPMVHGATPDYVLSEDFKTLPEYFEKNGYKTGGFTTHESWLNKKMGFAQGFDTFHSEFIDARQNNRMVFDFIEKNVKRKFFLFVHYYDIHSDADQLPYDTKSDYDMKFYRDYKGAFKGCKFNICASYFLEKVNREHWEISPEEIEYIKALYDGGIAYTDFHLSRLFNRLKELDLYEKTLIVITADHGEEFMEHGKLLHVQLYEETMRVPLIIKLPHRKEHKRITNLAGVIDIMPTILDIMEIPYENLTGTTLRPFFDPEKIENRLVYSFLPDYDKVVSVREGDYSFYRKKSMSAVELYNLKTDPAETIDISGDDSTEQEWLSKITENIKKQLKTKQRFKYNRKKSIVSKEEKEKLKSLGYVD